MTDTQRGSVTVISAALLAMVLVLAIGVSDLARALTAAARAEAAADASALASAQELALPSDRDPGDLAAEYAERNGAELVGCTCPVGAFDATVTVRVPVQGLTLAPGLRYAVASARAVVDVDGPGPAAAARG